MKKVYCYFLKSDPNTLYAFTINKSYKEIYETQRFMKKYICGIKEMESDEYRKFLNDNHEKMLQEDYLTDEDKTYTIIATNDESSQFSESCEWISDFLVTLKFAIKDGDTHLNLNKKYLDFISDITDILMCNKNEKDNILNINTYKVFIYLFSDTFFESDIKSDEFQKLRHNIYYN